MVGWHHQLNGHEFEQTPGDREGQGSLVCCRPWGHEESDMTWQLNNNCLTLETSCLARSISEVVAPGLRSCSHTQAVFQALTLTCCVMLGKSPSLSGPLARYSVLEPLLQPFLMFFLFSCLCFTF